MQICSLLVAVMLLGCSSPIGGHVAAGAAAGTGGAPAASSSASGKGGGDAGPVCAAPCGYPVGDAIDCAAMGQLVDGGCAPAMTEGLPCWRGVGVCHASACVPPAGQCDQAPPSGAWTVCMDDVDCDDGNPCTEGDCPEPGCMPCHQVPAVDGTPCGPGKACREGACCSP